MDLTAVIVLSLVQGVSAWIPVSSKTQVLLWGTILFNLPFHLLLTFALALHVGDVLALAFEYRKVFTQYITKMPKLSELKAFNNLDDANKTYYFLLVATIITGIIAFPLYLLVRKSFSALTGATLIGVIGLLLVAYAAFSFFARKKEKREKISLKHAVVAGMAQGFAVLPGVSRSGSTQGAMILSGADAKTAVRLSFMMGLPMILLAIVAFTFTDGYSEITLAEAAIGIIIAFVASLATMRTVGRLAEKVPFHYFSLALGVIALLAFAAATIFPVIAG